MPCPNARHRVGNLVQKHLVNLVVVETDGQVFRHGDVLRAVVAEPCACFRRVETERPLCGVEVEHDERIRPTTHPNQISHDSTIVVADDGTRATPR